MGRVFEHHIRGTVFQEHMDEDYPWSTLEMEDEDSMNSDESLDEYSYDYNQESNKRRN